MNKKVLSIIIICICFFSASSIYANENKLTTLDDRQLQSIIDNNKGKVIFVNFFATWCPPCKEEIPGLISLVKFYKKNEVMFIGLSVDKDTALIKPFIEKLGVNYPVYIASRDVVYKYGVQSIPHNAIYDHKGVLVVNAPGYLKEDDIRQYIGNILESKK